ncbi:hypothetical protein PGIGA_G00008680 [Pangasianodon gigas]|uniref:Uncharacterized protein n=1 Tax=Pangasianodon gigas TaxID=30993 RepID=A0ACC5W6G6_PANGG|nr:hypothetical protein [Pangasianodon gigas]
MVRCKWTVTHIHALHQDQGSDYDCHDGARGWDSGGDITTGDDSADAVSQTTETPAVLHFRSELSITMSSVVLSSNENNGSRIFLFHDNPSKHPSIKPSICGYLLICFSI